MADSVAQGNSQLSGLGFMAPASPVGNNQMDVVTALLVGLDVSSKIALLEIRAENPQVPTLGDRIHRIRCHNYGITSDV